MEKFPDEIPDELQQHIAGFAYAWAQSAIRPKLNANVSTSWDDLISEWISNSNLPLLARRSRLSRGKVILHDSGRELIPCDNTPAHWAIQQALAGQTYGLSDLISMLPNIPIAMALSTEERRVADYSATGRPDGPNKLGWKVCHLEPVKLGRGELSARPIGELEAHFRRFMSPSNMFLIPKQLGGLGEIEAVIAAVRQADYAS